VGFAIKINGENQLRKRSKMTPGELSNIAVEPHLSDQQKEGLKAFLTENYERLQEYRKQNPHLSKEDIVRYVAKDRSARREKLETFLTPEQLTKWDRVFWPILLISVSSLPYAAELPLFPAVRGTGLRR
jgi:hypothetical protein